jgi:hypothetical protein
MTDKSPGGEHTNAPRSGAQKSTVDQLIDELMNYHRKSGEEWPARAALKMLHMKQILLEVYEEGRSPSKRIKRLLDL